MNLKKSVLIGVVAIASTLYAYEPSVYGAGDINSASPYGLTTTEQAILDNKKTLQKLFNKISEQQRKIDGLTSIIEGQNREILELKEDLKAEVNKPIPKPDNNETMSLLLQLSQMVDSINNSYVTQDELKKALAGSRPSVGSYVSSTIVDEGSPSHTTMMNEIQNNDATVGSPIGSNSADIYREGVQLFGRRSYSASKEHFEQTLAANYKPASSNYYLGEIAYYTHNYSDAIAYYKQSASLYDTASYMDVLYLHTAISLDKNGEKEQAKGFYQYVIDNYPTKKSASIARKRM